MLRDGVGFNRIIICCGRVNLTKGVDGLAAFVRLNYGLNTWEKGTVFLFCGRRADRIQPSQPATVLAVTSQSYTPSKKMVRGTSSSVYGETLEVSYGDGQIATVTFSDTNPFALPKEGDEIQISRWGAGMAIHPNRSLIAVGGTVAIIGGFFLVTFLLTKWSMSKTDRARKNRHGI